MERNHIKIYHIQLILCGVDYPHVWIAAWKKKLLKMFPDPLKRIDET